MIDAIDLYATSPCAIYPPCEIRDVSASAPSLDVSGYLDRDDATRPLAYKKTYTIVYVDNVPLAIATDFNAELPAQLPQVDIGIPTPVILTDRLNLIKERLSLSITQLAELLGVTRKAVYDWYEGAEPRPAMLQRMETLIAVIESIPPHVDLGRLKAVWNIPISGKSFRAVVGDDSMDSGALHAALIEKLNELSSRMAVTVRPTQNNAFQHGEAHLAEFDRRTDLG